MGCFTASYKTVPMLTPNTPMLTEYTARGWWLSQMLVVLTFFAGHISLLPDGEAFLHYA